MNTGQKQQKLVLLIVLTAKLIRKNRIDKLIDEIITS